MVFDILIAILILLGLAAIVTRLGRVRFIWERRTDA